MGSQVFQRCLPKLQTLEPETLDPNRFVLMNEPAGATLCKRSTFRRFDRGTARAEDAQGTPTQSHISPSILGYEDSPEDH